MNLKTKMKLISLKLYKLIVPGYIKKLVTMQRNKGGLNDIRLSILKYYGTASEENNEINDISNYLKKNPLTVFQY